MKKSTAVSPFGHLIQALSLSITQISRQLGVDRTLVGKWKNGTRKIRKSADYYQNLLDCLLDENEHQQEFCLENVFLPIYGKEAVKTPAGLRSCLEKFLAGNIKYTSESVKAGIYTTSITAHLGMDGRMEAFQYLLDVAENSASPVEIICLDHTRYLWLNQSAQRAHCIERFQRLLDNGVRFSIIHYAPSPNTTDLEAVYTYYIGSFHKNINEYFYRSYPDCLGIHSYYILKDKVSLMGIDVCPESGIYTAVFHDYLSIQQHQNVLEEIQRNCVSFYKMDSAKQLARALHTIQIYSNRSETTYYANFTPGFMTMEKPLLLEVLEANHATKKEISNCMKFYSALRKTITTGPSRHLYYYSKIVEYVQQEAIVYYALSEIMGRPISVSRKQFLTHLEHIIHLLQTEPCFSVRLDTSVEEESFLIPISIFCRENLWAVAFDNQKMGIAKMTYESLIVNNLTLFLRQLWESRSTEAQNKDFVISRLQTIISQYRE